MTTAAPVAIAAIQPSATNPRRNFDPAKLEELVDSIKRYGVLQPILVRPNGTPDTFELVAGERRYRAAKAAGLVEIPATVRELSDADVLEIQVIENLQRADLHELEEAEGYERLLKCQHATGERYTVEEIATKVGKSRTYVFGRLKLLALCPEARKAFFAGELDASRALLIARIAHHDTQRQALKEITKGRFSNSEPMSYREAHQHVLNNFMLQLKSAPFDTKDAALHAKAGACGPCPKRTGNQADLFGDVKSADVCTDPKCFDDKRQAHYGVAAKKLEADGFKVIVGDAAKKILPHWEHHRPGNHYLQISGYEQFGGTTYVNGRGQKISSLFEKGYKPTKLQHPLTGEVYEVVSQQAIAAAAKKAKKDTPAKKAKAASSSGPRERKLTPEEIYNRRLLREISNQAPHDPDEELLRWIALDMLEAIDLRDSEALAEAYFPRPSDPKAAEKHDAEALLEKDIGEMDSNELLRLLYAMMVARALDGHPMWLGGKRVDVLKIALKRTGVNPAKVKKAIADEEKVAAAAKPAAAAKKKPAKVAA